MTGRSAGIQGVSRATTVPPRWGRSLARRSSSPAWSVLAPAEAVAWYEEDVARLASGRDLVLVEPAGDRAGRRRSRARPAVRRRGPARRDDLRRRAPACAQRRTPGAHRGDRHRPGEGYLLAAELAAAGVDVAGVADRRPSAAVRETDRAAVEHAGARLVTGLRDVRAHGRSSVTAVTLVPDAGDPGRGGPVRVACDTVCMAVGARPAVELAAQRLADGSYALYDRRPRRDPGRWSRRFARPALDGRRRGRRPQARRGPRRWGGGRAGGCRGGRPLRRGRPRRRTVSDP